MSDRGPGCRKVGAVGCLGLLALLVVVVGISAIWAWTLRGGESIDDAVVTGPPAREGDAREPGAGHDDVAMPTPAVGRIVLDLGQGDFRIWPGERGEPTRVEASYDTKLYELEESVTQEDSLWVFTVRFRRTAPGLVSLFSAFMGSAEPEVDVFISPDEPVELDVHTEQGGIEMELGGLWITRATLAFRQGGGSVSIDEPLRAPMDTFSLESRMGGFEAVGLANASPRLIDIRCSMGGADIDLDGEWLNDAEVRIDVSMGGVDVDVPDDVDVEGVRPSGGSRLREGEAEMPRPTLRFDVDARMGGVEVSR